MAQTISTSRLSAEPRIRPETMIAAGVGTVSYTVRPVKITVVYGGDPGVTVTVKSGSEPLTVRYGWFYGYGTVITAVFWDR